MSYVVAMAVPNEVAFGRWHPEFLDTMGRLNKAGKQACGQFFRYNKNRDYMEAYRATLEAALGRRKAPSEGKAATSAVEVSESRTDRAVKKLVSDVLASIEANDDLNPEVLKDFVDVARKLGVLKDEEQAQEPPRRYLPETCSRCRYRIFIEENIRNGNIEETGDNEDGAEV